MGSSKKDLGNPTLLKSLFGLPFFIFLLIACSDEHTEQKQDQSPQASRLLRLSEKADSLNQFISEDGFYQIPGAEQTKTTLYAIQAMRDYQRLKDDRKDSLTMRYTFNIGQLYSQMLNDKAKAIEVWQSFVTAHPDHPRSPEAYMLMANAYHDLGENDLAIEQVQLLKKRYPKHYLAKEADAYIEHVLKKSDSEILDYLDSKKNL